MYMNNTENTIDRNITKLKRKFKQLLTENKRLKNVEVDIQLKEGAKMIQQKGRPLPIRFQPAVGKETERQRKRKRKPREKTMHIGKAKNILRLIK